MWLVKSRWLNNLCYFIGCFRIFSHPNVLPVLGAVNESGSLVILSQYMPYGSLYNVLHEGTGTSMLNY